MYILQAGIILCFYIVADACPSDFKNTNWHAPSNPLAQSWDGQGQSSMTSYTPVIRQTPIRTASMSYTDVPIGPYRRSTLPGTTSFQISNKRGDPPYNDWQASSASNAQPWDGHSMFPFSHTPLVNGIPSTTASMHSTDVPSGLHMSPFELSTPMGTSQVSDREPWTRRSSSFSEGTGQSKRYSDNTEKDSQNNPELMKRLARQISGHMAKPTPNLQNSGTSMVGSSPTFTRYGEPMHTLPIETVYGPSRTQSHMDEHVSRPQPIQAALSIPLYSGSNPSRQYPEARYSVISKKDLPSRHPATMRTGSFNFNNNNGGISDSSRRRDSRLQPSPSGQYGGTSEYATPYNTNAGQGNIRIHRPSEMPTGLSTPSHVAEPSASPLSGNRQKDMLPAVKISQQNYNPYGDDPDNWIKLNPDLDPLPRCVIIPMHMKGQKLFAQMKVGHPGQTLTVEFDTGSTQLWLLSADMCRPPNGRCRANAKPFDRSMSTTYQPDGSRYMSSLYGSGKVTGTYGIDTITLGEPGNQLVIKNQKIGEAKTITGTLLRHSDAICGMSLVSPEMMHGEPASFLYTMTKQYGTTLPFGFYYNRYHPERSKMFFGEGYQQFIVEELNTHNVHPAPGKDKFDGWYVKFSRWVIEPHRGKPAIDLSVDPKMLALVDTGASLIVGPEEMIRQIKQDIFSYTNIHFVGPDHKFSCNEGANKVFLDLPDISFYIDEIKYTIAPHQYIANMGDGCGALFEGRPEIDHIILGRPFLNKYFSRFNHSRKTVQFALAKQDTDTDLAQADLQIERLRRH